MNTREARPLTRRQALKVGVGAVGLAAVTYGANILLRPGQAASAETGRPYTIPDTILDVQIGADGKPSYIVRPDQTDSTPVRIEITSDPSQTNEVQFRVGSPSIRVQSVGILPASIASRHALRVAGEPYLSTQSYGNIQAKGINDTSPKGLWFKLTDEQGNPVTPDGTPVSDSGKAYYVAGNYVTVDHWDTSVKAEEFRRKHAALQTLLDTNIDMKSFLSKIGGFVNIHTNLRGVPFKGQGLQPKTPTRSLPVPNYVSDGPQSPALSQGQSVEWQFEVVAYKTDGVLHSRWAAREITENGVTKWAFNAIEVNENGKPVSYITRRSPAPQTASPL